MKQRPGWRSPYKSVCSYYIYMLILCVCINNRGFRGGDPASRYAQEQYPSSDVMYDRREPRRRHDGIERWRGSGDAPPGAGRRLPRPRGPHGDADRWRSAHGGYSGPDDHYPGGAGRRGPFDARSGDYHPQRLMRGMDGLDGPPRFTYAGSWRSRYDDDYPPERTELWTGENRHRLDTRSRHHHHRLDPTLRNDSLSSDPSDCMSAPAIPTGAASAARLTPKHHRARKNGGSAGPRSSRRQSSMSSSDDGAQTTPEGTSCDEQEIESESIVSEMGKFLLSLYCACFFDVYAGAIKIRTQKECSWKEQKNKNHPAPLNQTIIKVQTNSNELMLLLLAMVLFLCPYFKQQKGNSWKKIFSTMPLN